MSKQNCKARLKSSERHQWPREEITVRKLGTSPIPNVQSKSWEMPHGRTVPSNTIKIPHILPPWPGVGGGGGRDFNW